MTTKHPKRLLWLIAKRHRPQRTIVRFRKDGELRPAHAQLLDDGRFEVLSPPPFTREGLYVFLHECAHITLGHCDEYYKGPEWLYEYEAEKWAHSIMRLEGVPVPRSMVKSAKDYVRGIVELNHMNRKPMPPAYVLRWCGWEEPCPQITKFR